MASLRCGARCWHSSGMRSSTTRTPSCAGGSPEHGIPSVAVAPHSGHRAAAWTVVSYTSSPSPSRTIRYAALCVWSPGPPRRSPTRRSTVHGSRRRRRCARAGRPAPPPTGCAGIATRARPAGLGGPGASPRPSGLAIPQRSRSIYLQIHRLADAPWSADLHVRPREGPARQQRAAAGRAEEELDDVTRPGPGLRLLVHDVHVEARGRLA
jgi:hypothetical protein